MVITIDDLKSGVRRLQCSNTGRCTNDDRSGMKYDEVLLTYLMNQDKKKISFQSVIDAKVKDLCNKYKIERYSCGLPPEMEAELKEFAAKAMTSVAKYIAMQCEADLEIYFK